MPGPEGAAPGRPAARSRGDRADRRDRAGGRPLVALRARQARRADRRPAAARPRHRRGPGAHRRDRRGRRARRGPRRSPDGVTRRPRRPTVRGPARRPRRRASAAHRRSTASIVVGGDMPTLVPAVLGRLLAALGEDADAVDPRGRRTATRSCPMALVERAGAGRRRAASSTPASGGCGPLLDALEPRIVPSAEWRATTRTAGRCATSTRRPTSSRSGARSGRRPGAARTGSRPPPSGGHRGR